LDRLAREAALVRPGADRRPDLGGEHRPLAPPLQRLADDHLRLPLGVAVGGVDEIDPCVQRPMDDADRLLVIGVPPTAEHHRAEAERGDLQTAPAEIPVLHRPSPLRTLRGGSYHAPSAASTRSIRWSESPLSTRSRHSAAGSG